LEDELQHSKLDYCTANYNSVDCDVITVTVRYAYNASKTDMHSA